MRPRRGMRGFTGAASVFKSCRPLVCVYARALAQISVHFGGVSVVMLKVWFNIEQSGFRICVLCSYLFGAHSNSWDSVVTSSSVLHQVWGRHNACVATAKTVYSDTTLCEL